MSQEMESRLAEVTEREREREWKRYDRKIERERKKELYLSDLSFNWNNRCFARTTLAFFLINQKEFSIKEN